MSVCIWFQDCATLRSLSSCPWRPLPHLSACNYFTISVQILSRVASQLFFPAIRQVIWPSPGTLIRCTNSILDTLSTKIVPVRKKNVSQHIQKREIVETQKIKYQFKSTKKNLKRFNLITRYPCRKIVVIIEQSDHQ